MQQQTSPVRYDEEEKRLTLEKIYQEHYKQILGFLMIRCSGLEVAEDLSHEVFLKFARYYLLNDVRQSRSLLFTIARGVIVDHYRAKQKIVSIEEVSELETLEDETDIQMEVDDQQLFKTIEEGIRALSAADQEVLHLRYQAELEYSEMAEVLGKSEGAVRVMLHRAQKRLKEVLSSK